MTILKCGQCFLDFCEQCRLWLPVTFTDFSDVTCDQTTFTTSDGIHHVQMDFIAVSWDADVGRGSACVLHDFDMFAKRPDRRPAAVRVSLAFSHSHSAKRRRRPCYPRGKILTADEYASLFAHFATLSNVPWQVDAESHLHVIVNHLRLGLCALAERGTCQPHQKYMSEVAFFFCLTEATCIASCPVIVVSPSSMQCLGCIRSMG